MERLRYRKHRGNTVTIDEAREKVRELKVLVELLHSEALCHPENCEAQNAWRTSGPHREHRFVGTESGTESENLHGRWF
jgi:hypothetical protein